MKNLDECKIDIRSCSKCGLCQSVCPVYKATGNDCTVSRGLFIMLNGLLKNKLKPSKKIKHYLDLCLMCNACSKFCPSGIDAVKIFTLAKNEFFKFSYIEKLISLFQKYIVLNFAIKICSLFAYKSKSETFSNKVVFFGGCSSKIYGNSAPIKILNTCSIETLLPNFDCCGITFLMRGDLKNFDVYMKKFAQAIEPYRDYEIVTTCASCEKILKSYSQWSDDPIFKELKIKNIFEYIRENKLDLRLKQKQDVTFHKPCNINNYEDIQWILNNTKNLNYIKMNEFESCCGLNGILKFNKHRVLGSVFKTKRKNIINTGTKTVLTSCLGCKIALKLYSFGKYKVADCTEFLAKHI